MQINEFIEATSKLETYYGKEYSTEQRSIMYDELKDFDLNRYRQLISAVLKKCKFLPKLADIIEANIEQPYIVNEPKEEKIQCEKCNSTGYICYIKEIDNGIGKKYRNVYGALCSCGNAKQYRGWEITDKKHRTNFYTPYAKEIGI
jgi:hypothetical protein